MPSVGLIDFDGKIPNLALMKISSFYKAQGYQTRLNTFTRAQVEKVFCSVIFAANRPKAEQLAAYYPSIEFGGTGWDLHKNLPAEIEACRPDYDLYLASDILPRIKGAITRERREQKALQIVNAGIGYTSRGCPRRCGFCVVPQKEGALRSVGSIGELVNPRSNVVILLDNNLTADPDCLEKLREIRERGLVVDITQGIDVRNLTEEISLALAGVKHLRSIHYAWDQIQTELLVVKGISTLSRFVSRSRHLCFILVGYDTTYEEDEYRVRRLLELGVDPYVMVYNRCNDVRLKHWKRFINGRVYKSSAFEDYVPWKKVVSAGGGLCF